jgi:predicted small secreted protein
MAYSRTLAELELAVRREADMVNSQFVTSAEVRSYINQSWAELYDRMVMFDQEYLLRYVDISAAASSANGDFDVLVDGQTGIVLQVANPGSPGSGTGYVVGEEVTLYPVSPPAHFVAATARVTSIDIVSGAVITLELTSSGFGYGASSGTSAAGDFENVSIQSSGGGGGGFTSVIIESDFYKCKGVWIGGTNAASPGGWNPLRRFQWEEQNALRQADLYGGLAALPLYRVYTLSGREKVALAPMISGTYRIWYYPAPKRMLSDVERIDGRAGWDEWVVKDSAMKCLIKEESIEQAASMKVMRDDIFKRFEIHAAERDATQPERIRNVRLLSRRAFPWR